jgi:hypothetical protein
MASDTSPAEILLKLQIDDLYMKNNVTSSDTSIPTEILARQKLEQMVRAQKTVTTTTYFINPKDSDAQNGLGSGQGTFEITAVTSINTNLDLDGNGNCSFSIEDPYKILLINDDDIEVAINQTGIVQTQMAKEKKDAFVYLQDAQEGMTRLSDSRKSDNKAAVTFNVMDPGGVTANIGSSGSEIFQYITEYDLSQFNGTPNEFSEMEKKIFSYVMANLKKYREKYDEISRNLTDPALKEQTEYVRKKMRLFHLGKYLIQPMDSVNVFMDGGTRKFDSKNRNDNSKGYSFSTDTNFNIDDQLLQKDYENYLSNSSGSTSQLTYIEFKQLRLLQLSSTSGIHVFGGIIETVQDSFRNGAYSLDVSANSNMHWLKLSRYNVEPGLEQSQGIVQDPLTPFIFKIDPATGLPSDKPQLSPENQALLFGECKRYVNFGANTGKEAKNELPSTIKNIGPKTVVVYDHINGLQYRWKEGIMTATYTMNVQDSENNTYVDPRQLRRDTGYFWSNKPFENLDAANIISILTTGVPYNPSSFIQSARLAFVPSGSLNTGKDYFSTLFAQLETNVKVNGNFIPYKTINVSREELAMVTDMQIRLTGKSTEMQQLRKKYAELSDQRFGPGEGEMKLVVSAIEAQKASIQTKIVNLQNEFLELGVQSGFSSNTVIQIAGDDVSYDIASSKNPDDIKTFGDRLNFLTLRKKEDVIYNMDRNLFIVSDEYDKDYDIQAFVLQMRSQSPDQFKSSWLSVNEICESVAKNLNFEFFCSTQGHLVFRPPQYNRIPLTVLHEMFKLYHNSGIRIYPEFLDSLFASREYNIIRDIAALEWQIVLKGTLLGCDFETKAVPFNFSKTRDIITTVNESNNIFLIESPAIMNAKGIAKGDSATSKLDRQRRLELLKQTNASTQLTNGSGLFTAYSQNAVLKDYTSKISDSFDGPTIDFGPEEKLKGCYDFARKQISVYSGTPVSAFEEYDKVKVGTKRNGKQTFATDLSKIVSDIAALVSRRSSLLRTLERVIENMIEVRTQTSDGSVSTMLDSLNKSNFKLQIYEDDTKDYLGFNSRSRFIIKDEHIISYDFKEQPPEMTTVTINGAENVMGSASQMGDAMGTRYVAFGADFDMWRQYGWRNERTVEVPFFTSAELQCAPYAVMLLSRQRKNVITGTVTLFGNEFYQLGDVVYLNDRRLLYYVDGISHNFKYGETFSTTLKLKYGHPVGEYIPTPLDVIGKMSILGTSAQTSFRMSRGLPNNNELLGIIQFDNDEDQDMLNDTFGEKNYSVLKSSAIKAKASIIGESESISPQIFLVSYSGEESFYGSRKVSIMNWFTSTTAPGPKDNLVGPTNTAPPAPSDLFGSSSVNYTIDKKFIKAKHMKLCSTEGAGLSSVEEELIRVHNIVASQESMMRDPTLKNIIEIRLVKAPQGGWK